MSVPRTRLAALILVSMLALSLAAFSAGCANVATGGSAPSAVSQDATDSSAEDTAVVPGEEPLHTAEYKPNGKEIAVIETSKGTIEVEFFAEDAPNHVASFIELARQGFYDGVKFHRVVPDFVVQGGDPQTRGFTGSQVAEVVSRQAMGQYGPGEPALGTGGPGYRLAAEFNARQHLEGTLAMARSQSPDSGGSQFYICLAPQPSLDGQYTVFGQVTKGMDVVKTIEVGDEIVSVTVRNASE
jgi:peptidyl-prolyl cis-trans isomerase B (cyclophilin B)